MNKMRKLDKAVYLILGISILLFLASIIFLESMSRKNDGRPEQAFFEGTVKEYDNKYVIDGHFTKEIPPQEQIMMYVHRMNVEVRRNGELVYDYKSAGIYSAYTRSVGTDWACFNSPEIKPSDTIQFTLIPMYAGAYRGACQSFLKYLYVGDRDTLLQQNLQKNMMGILISLLILIVGIAFLVTMSTLQIMGTPVARGYFACGMLLICGSVCTFINYDYITLLFPNAFVVNQVDYLTQILICEFMLIYFRDNLINPKMRRIVSAFVVVWTVVIAALICLQGLRLVDGIKMIITLIPYALAMVLLTVLCMIIDYKEKSDFCNRLILTASILLCITTGAEIYNYYHTAMFWIQVFQFGLLFFAIIQFYVTMQYAKENILKAERTSEMEKEVMRNKIAIMLSQIQPHFLYNALSGIRELCLLEPQKAYEAMGQFSGFLRANMDSLGSMELIPFETELNHVKNYLYLEELRFEELLNVDYDIQVTDFLLPALSIQPIVENAVRYGVSKKENGGTVKISTKMEPDAVKIIVEDDGEGFAMEDTSKIPGWANGRSHVGIANVRNRIENQCNGTVKIESRPGKGTTVTIILPKEDEI